MKKLYSFFRILAVIICFNLPSLHALHAQCYIVNQGAASDPTCDWQTVNGGAGAYWTINVTNGVIYSFYWGGSSCSDNTAFCIDSNTETSTSGSPYLLTAGATGSWDIGFYEANTTWCGNSATLNYEIATPTATAGPTTSQTICASAGSYQIPAGYTYGIAGLANRGAISWSSSGNGSFTGGTTTTPIYTLGSNDLTGGPVTLTMTNTNGACAANAIFTLNVDAVPTTSTVGATQNICGGLVSGALGGNSPAVGTGAWSQTSGPGSTTFSNAASGSATATATAYGTYVYTWTISNGALCSPSAASVTVNYYPTPTTATVGPAQDICGSLVSGALGGNTPAAGTGTWSQLSGPGSTTFSSVHSGSSTATATQPGTYVYEWTIASGTCLSSSASMTVNYYAVPTTATAGPAQNICGTLVSGALGGNTPAIGSGVWTQTAGPGSTTFSDPASGTATATATAYGTYIYTWTISNGNCAATSANDTVTFFATPTIATVGATQNVCGALTSASLGGNTPAVGTGTWTQSSGPGSTTFSNANSGSSAATVTVAGSYEYYWTISNGTCAPSVDSVTVNYILTPSGGTIANTSYCASVGSASVSVTGVSNADYYAWSLPANITGTSTSASITVGGSLPGVYTVTVTPEDTAFGATCYGTPVTGTVTILSLPVIDSINAGALSCFGGSNDTITVYATTSNGNLYYSIDGGTTYPDSNGVFANETAGNYYVAVKDDSSCVTVYGSNPVNVASPPQILLSIASFNNVLCNGDSTGYINLQASGGTGQLTFVWTNGATAQDISHLAAGSFTVTATDANSCTSSISQSITQPTALTDSISATNISCYGANNATATFIVSGGSPPYKYLWSNGDTSMTITNLNGAVYSVTATDNNGCIAVSSVNIINPQPVAVSLAVTNISCYGSGDGGIVATVTGGTPGPGGYSYAWSPSVSTGPAVTGASPGTYIVTVSDANGCSAIDSATVTQPLTGLSVTALSAPVGCAGDSSGSIQLLPAGGVGGYVYSWSSGQSLQIISGLPAGYYTGSVTDANGCVVSVTDTLQSPPVLLSSIEGTNISCYGGSNGTLSLTAVGGVMPYSILWNNDDTSSYISGVTAGQYGVIITDAYGCKQIDTITLTQPQPLSASVAVTNVGCNGAATGSVVVTTSGGTPSYGYAWSSTGSIVDSVSGVGPGTYTVTISDANGCSITDSGTVTQPASAIAISSIVTPVTCSNDSNGAISVLAGGGTGAYTYSWTGSSATTSDIASLSAGAYTVTVTDGNGCSASLSDTLTNPSPIITGITGNNVTCAGAANGSVTLTVSGGTTPYTYLWSNFETTQNLNNIGGGNYFVIVKDSNGCQSLDSIMIFEPQPLVSTVTVTNVSCNGASTGSVVAAVTGGTTNPAGYNYTWSSTGSTVDSVSGVGPGTYTVTISDANGCSITDSGTVTQPLTALSVSAVVTGITCNNDSNGVISVLASGGIGGYTYSWTGSSSAFSELTGLSAGSYTVTVTDANGCTGSISETLSNPAIITSNIAGTNVTCAGAGNGSAILSVSGGTPGYTYLWSNFDTAQNLLNIGAGLYRVIITDANGCKNYDSVIVTEPQPLTAIVTVRNVGCAGGNTGSVTVTASGGTPGPGGYIYSWSPVTSSTDSVSGVGVGTYTVTISDANGCSIIDSGTVSQLASTLSAESIVTEITCHNADNGAISILASGGSGGYTYQWTGSSATTSTISSLSAGDYTVTVTDGNGCTATLSDTLTDPTAITSSIAGTNVTCAGASNGSAILTVSGGTPGYTYLWSNFDTSENQLNIPGGLYRVIITDANGCRSYDSIVIAEPQPLVANVTVSNVLCYGAANGSVVVSVTGGTPAPGGYTYSWSSTGSTADSVSGVGPGTYTVTISDANSCSITASGTVTQPASALSVLSNVVNVSCGGTSDGSITLSVNGGVPAYTFLWSTGPQTQNLTSLAAGAYTVTVTDVNGCSTVVSDTVHGPVPIVSGIVGTNVSCYGGDNGSATLNVSGGTAPYTFLWSNFSGAQNLDSITAGWYYVIITDGYGCQSRDSVRILQPQSLVVTDTVVAPSCYGGNNGSVTLTVSGGTAGYTYAWTPSGPNAPDNTGLSSGNYGVTVTDTHQCTAAVNVTIVDPLMLTATAAVTAPACYGYLNGSIEVVVSGGTPHYSYTWSPNAPNDPDNTGLGAGPYTVTVMDSHGCSLVDSFTIGQPDPILISGIPKNVSCHGLNNGSILAIGYGGTTPYSYQWYLGADTATAPLGPITPNIQNLPGGSTYTVVITDANGCQGSYADSIIDPAAMVVTLSKNDVACAGGNTGSVDAHVSGGTVPYQYLWNNFSTDSSETAIGAGTYTVVVTDSNGCQQNVSTTVTQPAPIAISMVSTEPTCSGTANGALDATVSGGVLPYTYSWNTTPVQTGSSVTNIGSGTYIFSVVDSNGCTMADTAILTAPQALTVNTAITNPTCAGGDNGFISLDVHGGAAPYQYDWSTSPEQFGNIANMLTAGTYYDTIVDANGCRLIDSAVVASPQPIVVAVGAGSATCAGAASGVVVVDVTGGLAPYTYALGTEVQASDTFSGLSAGSYSVVVTDVNGCSGNAPVTVSSNGTFTDTLTASPNYILAGETVQLYARASSDTTILSYIWNPADSLNFSNCGSSSDCDSPTVAPYATQTYVVTVVNARGCSITDTVLVTVSNQPSQYIPTAFTPNNDGLNDYFEFDILGASAIQVTVWNRWGQQVYYNPSQPNGFNNTDGWNGYINGSLAPYDTYVYQLVVTYTNSTQQTISGTVTVMP